MIGAIEYFIEILRLTLICRICLIEAIYVLVIVTLLPLTLLNTDLSMLRLLQHHVFVLKSAIPRITICLEHIRIRLINAAFSLAYRLQERTIYWFVDIRDLAWSEWWGHIYILFLFYSLPTPLGYLILIRPSIRRPRASLPHYFCMFLLNKIINSLHFISFLFN